MATGLLGGIIALTVTAILFANVLMPTIVDTNTSTWNTSAASLWGTNQIILVVGFLFVVMAVFGINV